jgi:thiol-disulfide isomerase/thioredoxin
MSRGTLLAGAAIVVVAGVATVVLLAGGGGKGLAPESAAGQVHALAPGEAMIPAGRRAPLPAFAGTTLDGGQLDLASLKGQVVVLNFWASWCGPCRGEAAGLQEASRELAAKRVRVVGVDVNDQRTQALGFQQKYEVSYPSLFDPSLSLTARLGGQAPSYPPTTLVIDQQGRIAARIVGALNGGKGSPQLQAGLLGELVDQVKGAA